MTSKDDENIILEKDEKNQGFNMEVKDQWIGLTSLCEYSESSSPSKDTNCESTLKSHQSSLPQRMKLSMLKKGLRNNEEFGFKKCKKEELNAIGTYKSRGVKGVKEDCEKFRVQMKILKEKAYDSRIREVMVEGLVENMHKILNEDTTNVIANEDVNDMVGDDQTRLINKSISKNFANSLDDLNIERQTTKSRDDIKINRKNENNMFSLSKMKEKSNSPSPYTIEYDENRNRQNNAHEDFKARKRIKTFNNVPSYSNTSSSSTSSSLSSLSSLPLSHYIQKMKCLAPISYYRPHSFTNNNTNIVEDEQRDSLNKRPYVDMELKNCRQKLKDSENYNSDGRKTTNEFDIHKCNMEVDKNITNNLNNTNPEFKGCTLLPTLPLYLEPRTHLGIYASQRIKKSNGSFKNNSNIGNGDRINEKIGNIITSNYVSPKENENANKLFLESCNPIDGEIFQQPKHHNSNDNDNKYIRYEVDSLQQIIFNELKGLLKGFRIEIDSKNDTLKTRFEDMEKQWIYLKDEMFKETLEARYILQNDINSRLEEITNIFIKRNEDNDENILSMVEKKIERHQLQIDIGILALKSEMKHLWNEVKESSQKKENIQSCINSFIHTIEKSKSSVNNEQNVLKNKNNALMKQLENFKQSDMQIEIENIRKLVEKVQEDNVEFERTRSIAHMEGMQERMLIMERVENLSKLYLGGLEEIRSNVSNIKINFRDRVNELEGRWTEFKCHQDCYRVPNLTSQMLMSKLESIRIEVAEVVEAERNYVQETLDRENVSIQHQLMTACTINKREILNSMRVELNKRLQSAQNEVLLMTDALKQEMINLQCEVGKIQDGGEVLSKATSIIERETKIASKAATDATICATKAKEMLNDMQKSLENEITNVQDTYFQLKENLNFEKNMVQNATNEAHRTSKELAWEKEQLWLMTSTTQAKNLELNELIRKEKLNIVESVACVKNEQDVASQAAKEAKCSAIKAGEVLSEVLEYFNAQMIKVQHMNMQLEEEIEQEKQKIKKIIEIELQYNKESLNPYDEELEWAIKTWKQTMNVEIAKAKEITLELEAVQKQASMTLEQVTMLYQQPEHIRANIEEYISKTQHALNNLAQSIQQLEARQEDNHQSLLIKRQELEKIKSSCQTELNELQKMVQVLEKRLKESTCEQSIVEKRLEIVENVQVNLVQSYKDVRSSTSNLEKTAAIWLPKYEAATQIVNELSSKVKCMNEQFKLICGEESLMQQIDLIVESKINGMKDIVMNSHFKNMDTEVRELLQRIDNRDTANCHAIALLEGRVNVLENSPTQNSNMPLKLEYIDNCSKESGKSENIPLICNLNQNIETLQRKMEIIEIEVNKMVTTNPNQEFSSKILGLESRIEHIALATFTNLRLLDKKVELATVGMQSALDGAKIADKKCVILGFELVKVFRMFSCKKNNQCHKNNGFPSKESKEFKKSHSPIKKKDPNKKKDCDYQNKAIIEKSTRNYQTTSKIFNNLQPTSSHERMDLSPRKTTKKKLCDSKRERLCSNAIQSSKNLKSILQYEIEQDNEDLCGFETFLNERGNNFHNSIKNKECKLHEHLNKVEENKTPYDTNLDGQLMIEENPEEFVKNCQRTNIRLKAGRIHVNVSHRSKGLNQLPKKNDLITVQS